MNIWGKQKTKLKKTKYERFISLGWEQPEAGSLLSRCWFGYFLGPLGLLLFLLVLLETDRHFCTPFVPTMYSGIRHCHNKEPAFNFLVFVPHILLYLGFETHTPPPTYTQNNPWVLTFFFSVFSSSLSSLLLIFSFLIQIHFFLLSLPLSTFKIRLSFCYLFICFSNQCAFSHCSFCIYWISWQQALYERERESGGWGEESVCVCILTLYLLFGIFFTCW